MSKKKVHCYARTLRRAWGLTQEELASLLPEGNRNRVSRVERERAQPDAQDILAYSLIFGLPAARVFPRLCSDSEEAVMQGAYRLHRKLEKDKSAVATRKRELMDKIRMRAVKSAQKKDI